MTPNDRIQKSPEASGTANPGCAPSPASSALLQSTLKSYTPARVQLQRTGHSLATSETLHLQLANAQARDAVYATLDVPALIHGLDQRKLANLVLTSAAATRTDYLRNPALGRTLSANSESALKNIPVRD